MTDKFSVGQKVRLIRHQDIHESQWGKIVTIKKPRQILMARSFYGKLLGFEFSYLLSDDTISEERYLEPVYDGDERSSWEAMKGLWQPKEISNA